VHALRDPRSCRKACVQHGKLLFISLLALVGAVILYLPVLQEAVVQHIPTLLRGWNAPAGNFPEPSFYVQITGILLLLGLLGFGMSFRRERFSLFQCTVLVSAIFIVFHLMFYRRFFLQFDFFLLMFAALAIAEIWERFSVPLVRGSLVVLLLLQAVISLRAADLRVPALSAEEFVVIQTLEEYVPRDALLLTLEPDTAPYLRGWLPRHRVGGPGLFDVDWQYAGWEEFLTGARDQRLSRLKSLPGPVYLYVSSIFIDYYEKTGEAFLRDPCFEETDVPKLLKVQEGCTG
jgi:hypothetical protein